MKLRTGLILTLLYLVQCAHGQQTKEVLFAIEGDPVYSSEFLRAYEKNKDIVIDKEEKDFDDYFELFLDFKLKLRQARDLKLDTLSNYNAELIQYREQLIQPYLQDPEAINLLTEEAYERTLWEVHASHILIRLAPDAMPADTLAAWNMIRKARQDALKADSFSAIAKGYSQDPSVKDNGGDLGYFGAFAMVYPFENAAYRTEVGKISEPFRTQFGYHILQVHDKRRSPGEVQVSHIMAKKDSNQPEMARQKILDIRQKLLQGDDFAKIAMAHSDDAASAAKGGQLPKFGPGRMIQGFDQAAFALHTEGEISEPFETRYGWHILRLDKKFPVASYEELRPRLETKVKNSSRSALVERSLALKFSGIYSVQRNGEPLHALGSLQDLEKLTDTLLRIEDRAYTGKDFAAFVSAHPRNAKDLLFMQFCDEMLIEYHKEHLEEHNEEFAATFQEYKDGLLLFELLQRVVWDRSEQDSMQLSNYFQAHRDRYVWKKRGDITIASCTRKDKAVRVRELMSEGMDAGEIKERVNEGTQVHVLFSNARLEEGSSRLPGSFAITKGVSEVYEEDANHFAVYRVEEVYEPQHKELYEARGEVVNDFQNYLEQQWVADLRSSYVVTINKKNYNNLKKRLSAQ